jgi:SAM-dependent methyltransferase
VKLLKDFYEDDTSRFWNPLDGMKGRDLHVYPLLNDLSGSVLEYGCGSGSLLINLAKEQRFTALHGVDISAAALRKIKLALNTLGTGTTDIANKIILSEPSDDTIPHVESNSIDVTLSLDTIEHVLNPYTVIDELYRVTKPGGSFIISVPNYGYIRYVFQLLLGIQPITGSDHPVSEWRHKGSRLGINILRENLPHIFSGALTCVCSKDKI